VGIYSFTGMRYLQTHYSNESTYKGRHISSILQLRLYKTDKIAVQLTESKPKPEKL